MKNASRDFSQSLACTFLHALTCDAKTSLNCFFIHRGNFDGFRPWQPLFATPVKLNFDFYFSEFIFPVYFNSMWRHITSQNEKSPHLQEKVERYLLKVKQNDFFALCIVDERSSLHNSYPKANHLIIPHM